MNIAAYCRVSTEKEDQLNSLEAQKEFFAEYTKRTGDNLVRLYADEGLSGTKIKNRKEFLRMMEDAERGLFDMVVVKDISRFARNTVDLLQNIRKLKALGIETQFLTANMTSMGNSEFVLTIFGALAQEESANTSKRVKFGKKINAEKGRVPNIVFGYDKTKGDYFNLEINPEEAEIVRQIYRWYAEDGFGASKIANRLNARAIKTKRGCDWSQNAICRILTNELYTGKIINGKEEVADFLTGRREERPEDEWMVADRPELRIIEPELFEQAQKVLRSRSDAFKNGGSRHSNQHLFSTLIKCKDCGWSFRRTVRTYKNTYVRWVCSGHNSRGANTCPNAVAVDEDELIAVLQAYFAEIVQSKKNVIRYVVGEFERVYKAKDENVHYEKELTQQLAKLKKSRQKYLDMYADDLISREELNEKAAGMRQEIERLEHELKIVSYNLTKGDQLEAILNETFKNIESITDVREMTNAQLRRIVDRIEVDHDGRVTIYLRLMGDLGLDGIVLVRDDHTQGSHRAAAPALAGAARGGPRPARAQQGRAPHPRRHGHKAEISTGCSPKEAVGEGLAPPAQKSAK
ncbi:MAG: recombinase family protein [Oscillospiraceae bacterium]|nr:recombinase family protein [Oscillospiraceae bacterium]